MKNKNDYHIYNPKTAYPFCANNNKIKTWKFMQFGYMCNNPPNCKLCIKTAKLENFT